MGRTMLLHHLLKLSEERMADIASGKVSPEMKTARRGFAEGINDDMSDLIEDTIKARENKETIDLRALPHEYEPYLTGNESATAKLRLKQMLSVVRDYEMRQAAIGGQPQQAQMLRGRKGTAQPQGDSGEAPQKEVPSPPPPASS
jgi:hypothetical protein